MKRAMGTVLAATALVLMGSDGAVRSDCPPVSGNCPPTPAEVSCVWNPINDDTCFDIVSSYCNACNQGSCSMPLRTIGLQIQSNYQLGSGLRPEGCCADISWGVCYQWETKACYIAYQCVTISGGTSCSKPNDLCNSWVSVGTTMRTGFWSVDNSSCCVEMQ